MKKNILLVDDDALIIRMYQNKLSKEGYAVKTATNGEEGLLLVNNNHFDLIISDINMPKMNGFEFIVETRKLPGCMTTPILILTTEMDLEQKMTGKKIGATGWMVKPIIPAQLIRTIKRVL